MAEAKSIRKLAKKLVTELVGQGLTVATAESCTGGWIAKAITDIAGSSAVFGYGIVSYSNDAKQSLLAVTPESLQAFGAVSAEVVSEMAQGAIELSGADLSVAVSGIAGPDGGGDEKPVGTVWFAWGRRDDGKVRVESECLHFRGDRKAVRRQSVLHALEGIRGTLQR